ncbi:IS200/IS605 family transposase [Cytophaga hutchinsonii]|jgi:putative transposase|uniref:Transposase n=1 Tax=Cytophaga hutchinsonii (strain ATCC 33406 / DSM 1761 / CIP 103989 / NBRC 15051 / NCIMB 9469 / D465) TaxID=269798 RepID=A0A6N4SN16_CYTH3|nr:IS200/IS605 family transposase [Cytophaga hutchinsonii]ABG57669.1 transposase [Cytophaga hutchinsonii ATCC 33406]
MSFARIWVHLVFATKNRTPFLTREIRYQVKKRIMQNCKEHGIFLQSVNGYRDHLHCLISLGKEQSISLVAQHIKGESSHWLNQNYFINKEFMWQDDYFAISVSESQVKNVIRYIKNQEQHHASKTFSEEAYEYNKIFGIKAISDN